jgi:dTDP-4-dehydrorhamnose reductase
MKIGVIGRGIILKKFKQYAFDVIDLDVVNTSIDSDELEMAILTFKDKSHIILCPTYTNVEETKLCDHTRIIYQNYVLPSKIISMLKGFKATLLAISSSDLYNMIDGRAKPTSELRGTNIYYTTKMLYDYVMQEHCMTIIRHSELIDDSRSLENMIYRVCTSKYVISDFTNTTTVDDLVCATVSAIKKRIEGIINIASPERISEYTISGILGYNTIPMSLEEWGNEFNTQRQMSLIDCSKMTYVHDTRVISYELIFNYLNTVLDGEPNG